MRPGSKELLLPGNTKSVLNIEHKPIGLKDQEHLKISLSVKLLWLNSEMKIPVFIITEVSSYKNELSSVVILFVAPP